MRWRYVRFDVSGGGGWLAVSGVGVGGAFVPAAVPFPAIS